MVKNSKEKINKYNVLEIFIQEIVTINQLKNKNKIKIGEEKLYKK